MRYVAATALGVAGAAVSLAQAVEPVAPPAMYPPDTWKGRSAAIVRVLDRLDSNVEMLTVPAGRDATFKSLRITVRSCLQHPPGLPPDAAASLSITDTHDAASAFTGWMFAAEPFVAVFQSPVYGVQLVSCAGDDVAPAAPPPPQPVVPQPVLPDTGPAGPDSGPSPVYPSGEPDAAGPPPD